LPGQIKNKLQPMGKPEVTGKRTARLGERLSFQLQVRLDSDSDTENHSFFDMANDAIAIHDIQSFEFLDINPKFTEMFGYTLEEMRNGGIRLLGGRNPFYKESEVLQWLQQAADGQSQILEEDGREGLGRGESGQGND